MITRSWSGAKPQALVVGSLLLPHIWRAPLSPLDLPRLVNLRRDGFDLDFDTRTWKLLDQ
jgi:hypothetical protein